MSTLYSFFKEYFFTFLEKILTFTYKKLAKEKYGNMFRDIMGKLYIAYGSNLNLVQMAARCPSASIYAKGVLNNWKMVYRGRKANSHATIIKKQGSTVPVLVWEIQPIDEYHLDIYEGYPRYYFKKNIMVTIAGRKKKAMVYIMDEEQLPGRPPNMSKPSSKGMWIMIWISAFSKSL